MTELHLSDGESEKVQFRKYLSMQKELGRDRNVMFDRHALGNE